MILLEKEKFSLHTVISHVTNFLDKSYRDNISALSGQSTFFLILSAVPLLMFAFVVASLLTGNQLRTEEVTQFVEQQGNGTVRTLMEYVIDAAMRATSETAVITAALALWSAGRGLYCITEGISRIYGLPNRRIWLFKRFFAMLYTLVILVMFLASLAGTFMNAFLSRTIEEMIGENPLLHALLSPLQYVVFAVLGTFFMTLALKLFLNDKVSDKRYCSFRALLPGTLFTVVLWFLLGIGVQIYLRNFATSSIYGSLGTVAVLMTWIYFMMYILLLGIELNYIYREEFSSFRFFKRKKKNELP